MGKQSQNRNKNTKQSQKSASTSCLPSENIFATKHIERAVATKQQFLDSIEAVRAAGMLVLKQQTRDAQLEKVLSKLPLQISPAIRTPRLNEALDRINQRIPIDQSDCRNAVIEAFKLRIDDHAQQTAIFEQNFEEAVVKLSEAMEAARSCELIDPTESISIKFEELESECKRISTIVENKCLALQSRVQQDPLAWHEQQLRDVTACSLPGLTELLQISSQPNPASPADVEELLSKFTPAQIRNALKEVKNVRSAESFNALRRAVTTTLMSFDKSLRFINQNCRVESGESFAQRLGAQFVRARIELINSYEILDSTLGAILPKRENCFLEPEETLKEFLNALSTYQALPSRIPYQLGDDIKSNPENYLSTEQIKSKIAERQNFREFKGSPELKNWIANITKEEQSIARGLTRFPGTAPFCEQVAMLICRVFFNYGDYRPYYSIDHLYERAVHHGIVKDRDTFESVLNVFKKLDALDESVDGANNLKFTAGVGSPNPLLVSTFISLREIATGTALIYPNGAFNSDALGSKPRVPLKITSAIGALEMRLRIERLFTHLEFHNSFRDLVNECIKCNFSSNNLELLEKVKKASYATFYSSANSDKISLYSLCGHHLYLLAHEARQIVFGFEFLAKFIARCDPKNTGLIESLKAIHQELEPSVAKIQELLGTHKPADWPVKWSKMSWPRVFEALDEISNIIEHQVSDEFKGIDDKLNQYAKDQVGILFDEI